MLLPAKVIAKRRSLFSASQLAERIGVSEGTLRKLESDPLAVQGHTLRAYLLALGWRLRVAKDFHKGSPHRLEVQNKLSEA